MSSRGDLESLEAHLRNLLTPYATLIDVMGEILSAKKEGDERKVNELLDSLDVYDFNNIQDIIDFSLIGEIPNSITCSKH